MVSPRIKRLVKKITPFTPPTVIPYNGAWPDTSTLNEGQLAAFNMLEKCLNPERPEHIGVLAGNAGTGKSYTTAVISAAAVKNLAGTGRRIAMVAPTHKAMSIAKMFSPFKNNPYVDFLTVASLLSIREDTDKETGEQTFKRFGKSKVSHYGSIIVDEASMLPEFQMKALIEDVGQQSPEGPGVIFVGDPGQLPPIKSPGGKCPAFSKSFWNEQIGRMPHYYGLTEQMRSAEGAPIHAKALACREPGGFHTLTESEVGKHSWSVTENRAKILADTDFLKSVFDGPEFRANPNFARVICYTRHANNAALKLWNNTIRQAIYGDKFPGKLPFIIKGEPLVVTKPLMSIVLDSNGEGNEMGKENICFVGETVRVLSGEPIRVTSSGLETIGDEDFQKEYKDGFKAYEVEISLDDRGDGTETTKAKVLVPSEVSRYNRFMKRLTKYGTEGYRTNAPDKKHRWDEMKKWRDATFLQTENCYALNIHRAQGSSYKMTILDYNDLKRQPSGRTPGFYVASSRAMEGQIVAV